MGIFQEIMRSRTARREAIRTAVGEFQLAQREGATPAAILLPARVAAGATITAREALGLGEVYRAVDILTGAAGQLGIDVIRQGRTIDGMDRPAIVRRPSLTVDRRTFIEQTVLSLAFAGNFYWLKRRAGRDVVALDVLNPHEVYVELKENGRREFGYRGERYSEDDMVWRGLMLAPGAPRGLGPIQAAQADLAGAARLREYGNAYFDTSGYPNGVLTSDQDLTQDEAMRWRNGWNELDANGQPLDFSSNPSRIKVMGKGMHFEPILVSPKDALWIDAQNFSVVQVARLMGVPSSLMLASIEGNSQTYQNVEQDWLGFVRFTLAKYLGKIEDAFTEVTPHGQTVRFNIETLLRSDTKTRYDAHAIALQNRWLTVDEVREIENLPPLTPAQQAALAPAPAPAPQEA